MSNAAPLKKLGSSQPTITGLRTVGKTLTAVPDSWSPTGVELKSQWSAAGAKIKNATSNKLVLTPSLMGKAITVSVSGSKIGYASTATISNPTPKIATAKIIAAALKAVVSTGKFTFPASTGVKILVNGSPKATGTYSSGYKKISITAKAKTGYTISGNTSWAFDLRKKNSAATAPRVNYELTTVTLSKLARVSYRIDGIKKSAGAHEISTYITVTAKASASNYIVQQKTWKYDMRKAVVPIKPVFSAAADTVKITAKPGVNYYVNGALKKAGTYKYVGTVVVTTKPLNARTSSAAFKSGRLGYESLGQICR